MAAERGNRGYNSTHSSGRRTVDCQVSRIDLRPHGAHAVFLLMSLPRGLRMSNWFSFTIIRKSDLVLVAEHRCENRKRQILASASSISYGQIVGWKLRRYRLVSDRYQHIRIRTEPVRQLIKVEGDKKMRCLMAETCGNLTIQSTLRKRSQI